MGDYAGGPQYRAFQAGQSRGAVLPGQGQGASGDHQHQQHQWHSWQCVSVVPGFHSCVRFGLIVAVRLRIADVPAQNSGQVNYGVAKAGVVGLTRTIAKEWGPAFGVRSNTIAFGHVTTRLTGTKEAGVTYTLPDGTKVALGIPGKQLQARGAASADNKSSSPEQPYADIPLRRPASPEEAARAIIGVASPYFSYVSGETIRVTGGRNM
jgi:NAD(P)-dependent dehydrogenase (short-subunit alcohol dehydrogenase family)